LSRASLIQFHFFFEQFVFGSFFRYLFASSSFQFSTAAPRGSSQPASSGSLLFARYFPSPMIPAVLLPLLVPRPATLSICGVFCPGFPMIGSACLEDRVPLPPPSPCRWPALPLLFDLSRPFAENTFDSLCVRFLQIR